MTPAGTSNEVDVQNKWEENGSVNVRKQQQQHSAFVLATEETTGTRQVGHRPIKCQSRLWSQRGTKVNGSHHGETRYSNQQRSKSRQNVMRLYKQWHRPMLSKRFIKPPYSISRATSIDSNCCRLATTSVLSNKADKLRSNQF